MPAHHRRKSRRIKRTRRRKNRNLFSRKRNNIGGTNEAQAKAAAEAQAKAAAEAQAKADEAKRIMEYERALAGYGSFQPRGVYHNGTAEWKAVNPQSQQQTKQIRR